MKSLRLFRKSIADTRQFVLQLVFIVGEAFFLLFGSCELVFNGGHALLRLGEIIAARAHLTMNQSHGEKNNCNKACHDGVKGCKSLQINECPFMAFGFSSSMMCKMVGAMSAKRPVSLSVRFSAVTMMKGTGCGV